MPGNSCFSGSFDGNGVRQTASRMRHVEHGAQVRTRRGDLAEGSPQPELVVNGVIA